MTLLPFDPTAGTHQLVVAVDVDAHRLNDPDYRLALVDQIAGLADERLRRNPSTNRRLHLTLTRLCYDRRVHPLAVTGGSRKHDPTRVRHEIMWIGVRQAGLPLSEMGAWLGGMDHTSVLHGRRKIDGLIAADRRVARRLIETWEQTAAPTATQGAA